MKIKKSEKIHKIRDFEFFHQEVKKYAKSKILNFFHQEVKKMVKDVDIQDDELCKWTIIDLNSLKINKIICPNCKHMFGFVGLKIICPKCNKIIMTKKL